MTATKKHKCSRCKELKSQSDFHRSSTHNSGVQRYCKECKKRIDRIGHGKNQGKYCVYYIPKHRYVGMTRNVTKRMQRHRKNGKDVTGYRVILATRSAKFAHTFESILHMLGFKGFRY